MKKLFIVWLFAMLGLSQLSTATTIEQCNGTNLKPCVVQDTSANSEKVKHWRTSQDILHSKKLTPKEKTGLEHLWMSGSAAPTAEGWKTIAIRIIKSSENKAENIIDVDLRQESHGYLNQNAITLNSENNWINLGKTHDQTIKEEKKWLHTLGKEKIITDVLTPAQFKEKHFSKGIDIKVNSVENEQKVAEAAGFKYTRLTVSDHMAPRDADVDRFLLLVKKLTPNTWVHLHCRHGDGRTTTFMAMYDMLHNADKVPLAVIIKRETVVSPHYDLFIVADKNPLYTKNYEKRAEFLKQFYQFARDDLKGYKGSWSDWKHKNIKTTT